MTRTNFIARFGDPTLDLSQRTQDDEEEPTVRITHIPQRPAPVAPPPRRWSFFGLFR